ncbi:MAG: beta-lactamase family protein [Planctomycetaceae bacterium]|nr:beta-lactamase family protein [Planctomycetaceae bacterium]
MTLPLVSPRDLGIDASRWRSAVSLASQLCDDDRVPAVCWQVVGAAGATEPVACGRTVINSPVPSTAPLPSDAIFLTASLSKPIVAMAAQRLVEDGTLSLQDRVINYLPEFDAAPKRPITIRHLLTHTSGLPDMLPNNRILRQSQAGLDRFISGTCGVTLDFPCGRGMQYQSMGFALLGEIITRVSGVSCAEFLKQELFAPLGMSDTALGAPEEWFTAASPHISRLAEVRVPEEQQGGDDWNWNSRYWRTLGAPWGGVLSTVSDLARFLRMMLRRGAIDGGRLFAPGTVSAATTNQLEPLHDLPEADRRTRPWGYGWRLNWTGHSATFGDLLPPDTYGHWGATGTVWWVDPTRELGLVLLSTEPLSRERNDLLRLSNAIAAAM